MADIHRYLEAATRDNTQRSYASAVRHFEVEWGGHLPTTADEVARYLADHANQLSINTLRQRLAALAQWHSEQGFADPTRSSLVRKVLKGIKALHPSVEKQAVPLQLNELGRVADWLDTAATNANERGDTVRTMQYLRDRALILLGFWRGFRADELIRLRIEHIDLRPGDGLTLFLSRSKTDRDNNGQSFKVPALSRWCPVDATQAWIVASGRAEGPLFSRINRWGALSDAPLDVDSIVPILRRAFAHAGLGQADAYSGHSLRRGFANWANANGWDIKSLMAYVGWRKVDTVMRYVDASMPFMPASTDARSPQLTVTSTPSPNATMPQVDLVAQFSLTSYTNSLRQRAKARKLIEEACLARHRAQRADTDGYRFHIQIPDDAEFEEAIATVLDDMYRIANNHGCYLEATISEKKGSRSWE
ncbi:site-specific integrase [Dyella acidisoli]|uniref:Recombinase n=2 Tax=Dyella acidisoli TaxID=1867834 RepID=A0ABQ5XMC2_9GAMM|nr:site-specific integrase [Dyella acidisoli]GLQ91663.1 recombinase [Dyella acidisoli]